MRKMPVVAKLLFLLLAMPFAVVAGDVVVTDVTATQRYPWNGLVDIVLTIHGTSDDVAKAECQFWATVSETGETIPVEHITRNGADSGSDLVWTRRLIWNAVADAGAVKINDLVLTVGAKILDGVQLWENGPYWAECNIGAERPEGYGYYFWWGDTIGYTSSGGTLSSDGLFRYDVKWYSSQGHRESNPFNAWACSTCGSNGYTLMNNGYIDSTGSLVAKYDAATAHCGVPWRMPTSEEFSALVSNCIATWITSNNVNGLLVTGKGAYSSRSIFLPAAGYGKWLVDAKENLLAYSGFWGHYWTSTVSGDLGPAGSDYGGARTMDFSASNVQGGGPDRSWGLTVRPVRTNRIGTGFLGVNTHLALDCRDGARKISAQGEILRYDVSWCADASSIRITDNGKVLETGTAGSFDWCPEQRCPTRHSLKLELLNGEQVLATETADFILDYISNVTARQLWPHKKVEVCYEVADDIDEVTEEGAELALTCEEMVAPELTFTTSDIANYGWTEDSDVHMGSGPAHKSGGYHIRRHKSTMSCYVSGAMQVSFFWKVSSEPVFDKLHFYVDDVESATAISGDVDWQLVTVDIDPLTWHTLKWSYEKDDGTDENSDCGWVDCIKFKYAKKAETVLGDKSVTPGAHRVVWDMEADGVNLSSENVRFTVNYEGIPEGGISGEVVIRADDNVCDGMCVGPTVDLCYSPIDSENVSLEVNGSEILSSSDSGTLSWSPGMPGTYVHTHRAGEAVFVRNVVYKGEDDAKELEIGWLDSSVSNLFPSIYANVTNVVIVPSLKELPEGAFAGCAGLKFTQQLGVIIQDGCVLGVNGECPEYVVIPEGVRLIADGAFRDCEALVSITLPSTLRYIGANAFRGCTNLECVELPEGLESIGDGAFRNCTWMQEVSFPSSLTSIGKLSFANCTMLADVECFDGLKSVGEGAFSNCWRVLSVALPVTVDEIGANAFYNCKNVLGVTLPAHIDTIAHLFPDVYRTLQSVAVAEGEMELVAGFFSGCEMLEEIVLSNAIKEIPDSTFEGCMELLRMRFPAELERIGNRAFYGCQKLTSLAFPDELISIGNSAFYGCSRVVELSFGENLREIGDDAFYGLPKIPNIVCPASVRSIGARAFLGVWDDVEIKLPEGLESLGVNAFAGCPSIRRVSLPALPTPIKSAFPAAYPQIQSVNILGSPGVIGQGFCRDVAQLCAIQIPASVTNIQGYAFSGLSNLAGIELPPNLREIGEYAFSGNSRLATIALPQSVRTVGYRAFYGCNNIRAVSCSGELATLSSLFPSAYSQLTTVSINAGTTQLMDDLMSGCANLSDIDLPFGITSIGNRAFKNCGALAAFGVPNGVVALGNDVFSGCSGLTSLSLPEGLESIPSGAFRNCYAISSIVIPASVTYIGAEAFYGCSALVSVAYLGYCPQFDSGCYSGTPTDLSSYVVFGSRGWDGIPTSKTLPEYWPTANARAIAYWEPNTFEATFMGNGGTPPSLMVLQTTGMTYILPENDPEMLGARFNGWWTQPVNGGRIKTTTKVEVTRAQTFYAHWKYNDYLIRFDANGGIGEMEDQMLTVDTPAELAANSFFRKNYRFNGWALSSEGEASFADGDEVENLSFEHNAVVTLYAVWAEQPWDAADYLNAPGRLFVLDGDAEWFADDDISHDGSGSLRSGVIAAAADGQRTTSVLRTSVVGTGAGSFWWKIDCEPADGIDYFDYCAFFIDGVEVAKIAGTVGWEKVNYEVAGEGEHALEWVFSRDDWDEDEALYENAAWVDEFEWAPTPVTLSFDANGAEGEAPVSVIKYAGCEVSLPLASTLTKDGMIFVGWSDGVGVFLPGDTYVLGSSDTVLYAVWDDKIWTLEEAANITGISFATGGDTDWMVDLATNYDGVASIKSGSIGDNQQTWVSMAVSGPGTIGFRTFVSGEFYRGKMCDYLKFEVDDIELFASYDANWSNVVVSVSGGGAHVLKWTYLKNSSKSTGYDCAWLDEVMWTPTGPFPEVATDAASETVAAALAGAADAGLAANVTDGTNYNAFCEWAARVKGASGSTAVGAQTVKECAKAWLSYALGADRLITKEPTSDDVKIESFAPSTTDGKFEFAVSVKDVNIGGGSVAEAVLKDNLKKVLGIEGAKSLLSGAFSSDNIDITFDTPVDGKAKFTVSPPDDAGNSFFMRVKVKQ